MGRKEKKDAEKRRSGLTVWLTQKEADEVRDAAWRERKKVSEYIREKLGK